MFDLFEKWGGSPRTGEERISLNESSKSPSDGSYSVLGSDSTSPYKNNLVRSKTFVLSVGGSIFFNEKLRAPEIAKFCEVINELVREGFAFVVVVGGGRVARVYQAGAKALGGTNFELDEIAISITRANALLFTHSIDNAWKNVLTDPKESENILLLGRTPIYGGTVPGQTTDSVASLIAEFLGVDMINLSDVDGVYSADPLKEPNAKMYVELTHTKLVSLLKAQASKPGAHIFIDPHAANILWRSRVKCFFINGNDLENFKNLVRGNSFRGTTISTNEND